MRALNSDTVKCFVAILRVWVLEWANVYVISCSDGHQYVFICITWSKLFLRSVWFKALAYLLFVWNLINLAHVLTCCHGMSVTAFVCPLPPIRTKVSHEVVYNIRVMSCSCLYSGLVLGKDIITHISAHLNLCSLVMNYHPYHQYEQNGVWNRSVNNALLWKPGDILH